MKTIRYCFEYRSCPVWTYDDDGNIEYADMPEEWETNLELINRLKRISSMYDACFVDTDKEFAFLGFVTREAQKEFIKLVEQTRAELQALCAGCYTFVDETKNSIPAVR